MKNNMKMKKGMILIATAMFLLSIGASITASAETIGEGYTIMGFPLGTFLIIAGILVGFIALLVKMPKPLPTILGVFAIAFIVIGAAMFINKPASVTPPSSTGNIVDDWQITGINSGTSCGWSDIDAEWDSTSSPSILSAPINLDASTNALDETKFRAEFNVTPSGKSGAPTDINCKIYYKTEYSMTKGGEDILEKDGSVWVANWTNSDGTESDYDGFLQMTLADGGGWVYCDYELDSGNSTFGEEMDGAIGETVSWKITFWDDYGFKEEYTVMVVKITDD